MMVQTCCRNIDDNTNQLSADDNIGNGGGGGGGGGCGGGNGGDVGNGGADDDSPLLTSHLVRNWFNLSMVDIVMYRPQIS